MEPHIDEFDATDCSRLAWLYLKINAEDKARALIDKGLALDPFNEYCLKLKDKFAQGRRAELRRP